MHRGCTARAIVVAFIAVGVLYPIALAREAKASGLLVTYNLRDMPSDPLSAVVWRIDLHLQPTTTNGYTVGWLIHGVTITQLDPVGEPLHVWTADTPTVASSGGLWWVTHADPQNPGASDFIEPPSLTGTAIAENPTDPDLDYYLEGIPYVAPPQGPPFATTAALDYAFAYAGSGPFAQVYDEPIEVPDPIEDPPVG
jgi:hypothetical protein